MKKSSKSSLLTKDDKSLLKEFGDNLRKVREGKNLTVYDVTGEDMPIKSRQHWQRIENGQKNISLTTIYKLAEALKINAKELL